MSNNKRLGNDPLAWIQNSRENALTNDSVDTVAIEKSSSQRKTQQTTSTPTNTSKKGLPPGFTRATVIVKEALWNEIKDYSYWERKNIKDIFEDMLESYLQSKTSKTRK